MKTTKYFLGALLLLSTLTACRQESDNLYNYAFNDALVSSNAQETFGDRFKMLWNGLNQNYSIFDYEAENGLNWDDVYNEYLPQFEALDQRDDVTDEELTELLSKVVSPLHDGHLFVQMKNHLTGNYVTASPSDIRNMKRDDYEISSKYLPDISSYFATDLKEYSNASTRFSEFWYHFTNDENTGMKWLSKKINQLQNEIAGTAGNQSEHDAYMLQGYLNLYGRLTQMVNSANNNMGVSTLISSYNELVASFGYLQVPGMYSYDPSLAESSVAVSYALTNDNIAYLHLTDFGLSPAVDPSTRKQFANASVGTQIMLDQVASVWQQWFDAIQYHHKAGDLKGVIIDLRGNNGGMLNDFQYLLGALIPAGDFEMGKARFKRGTGRFDYSVIMPYAPKTLAKEHVIVTEPIVVLTNCKSVSMAEITTQGVKLLANGKQIGKRTWGGLCGLNVAPTYSLNYAGYVGVMNETPVFCYVPQMTFLNENEQILEGVGLQPDIEVDFDEDLYILTGRDSQLDRAIEYIVNGK